MAKQDCEYDLSPIHLEVVDEEVRQEDHNHHCLIGKILLHKGLDQTLVEFFIQTNWNCKRGISVTSIQHNMFFSTFQDRQDLERVLTNRPWTIMGGLLMLKRHCNNNNNNNNNFNNSSNTSGEDNVPNEHLGFLYSPFWVQVHGLPLNYLTPENGAKIGALLGVFVQTDKESCWKRYLRVRVVLNVGEPLLAGFWLNRKCESGSLPDTWIDFKYEGLGVFCYRCGRIGYSFGVCKYPSESGKFGSWMRAMAPGFVHPARVNVVYSTSIDDQLRTSTTLLAVPVPKSNLVDENHEKEEDVEFEQTEEEYESNEATDNQRNLWQRVVLNSIDSTIMFVNCAIIFQRDMSLEAANEGNWKLLAVMAAYLSHLICKFICFKRDLDFLKAKNRPLQVLISVVFLIILLSTNEQRIRDST